MVMSKKRLYLFVIISFLGIGVYCFSTSTPTQQPCAFCNPTVLQRQTFYEEELILALYTHKPILPGHCLVIPKRHVERFEQLTDEEVQQMSRVIKKVNKAASKVFGTSSYLLLQKNGLEVGQSVPHVHFHYIPRKTGDSSTLSILAKLLLSNWKSPIPASEMHEIVEKMKEAMASLEKENSV